MRIAVRLDDIAPVMHWENFDRMLALLDRFQAKPLLGVIPECRDEKLEKVRGVSEKPGEEFFERMRALKKDGAVIAMHGRYHVYITREGGIFPLGRQSEFAGLPLTEQEELIRTGREILDREELATDIFMAPSHSYDKNTLTALKNNGFHRVTDGFGSDPYYYHGLTFYPIAMKKEQAVKSKKPGTVTLVYHVNTMKDEEFEAAETLFAQAELIAYKTLLFEPTVRRSEAGQRLERMLARTKRMLVGSRK